MTDVRRLHMLVELDRLGTISAVARSLSYSTSAVSQQLSQLEREVGAPLLEPDGRRVRLTSAGQVLVEHARAVIDAWERAQSAVVAARAEISGRLSVAAFETAFLAVLPELVRTMRRDHPAARLTMRQVEPDDAMSLVYSREIDLAILERFAGQHLRISGELAETALFDDPMLLAVPASLDREVRRPADVADLDWVMELPGSPTRDWALRLCRGEGFEPRGVYESSDVLVHHSLVRDGLAAAFIPQLTPARLLDGVRLVPLGPEETRTVFAVYRHSRADLPLLSTVVEALSRVRVPDARSTVGIDPRPIRSRP